MIQVHPHRCGFTLVEVLTILTALTLTIAAVAPVAANLRQASMSDQSLDNLGRLAFAHHMYAADWDDRQFTVAPDDLASYGNSAPTAVASYHFANGCTNGTQPACLAVVLGWCDGARWAFNMNSASNAQLVLPIQTDSTAPLLGFGNARMLNVSGFHEYVDGRVYSPTFYAPGDPARTLFASPFFDHECAYPGVDANGGFVESSYARSASALFDHGVMRPASLGGYQHPFSYSDGLRSPSVTEALYPHLKTNLIEHNWLGGEAYCNFGDTDPTDGCTPYQFNHSMSATPAALFYDGHARLLPTTEAVSSDAIVRASTLGLEGLWSRDTPLGEDGYFSDLAFDTTRTSHHVLTTDGIRGRDTLGEGTVLTGVDDVAPTKSRRVSRRGVAPSLRPERTK